jgi:hypothetical protein
MKASLTADVDEGGAVLVADLRSEAQAIAGGPTRTQVHQTALRSGLCVRNVTESPECSG